MNPNGADIAVDIPLTLVQDAYIQGANEFIADQIFPMIGVQKKVGTYYQWTKDDWYRSEAAVRAPATPSVGSGFGLTSGPLYNALVYAFHKDLDKQTRAELDAQGLFDIEAIATRFVSRQLLLKREQIFASTYFGTGIWTDRAGVASGPTGTQFLRFDDAGSVPVDLIGDVIENMAELTGLRPNVMVTTPRVMRALRRNPQIADLAASIAPYTGEAMPTARLLQEVLEIPRVVVARTIINTAVEGATAAYSPLYGKHILLAHVAADASLETPSAGYIFNWVGYDGASFAGNAVYKFPLAEIQSQRIEGEMAFDMKATATLLGTFLADAIS